MDNPTPIVDAPSKPPRRFRRTRIAVSVFFGILTVAILLLWTRSKSRMEFLERRNGIITRLGVDNDYVFFISRNVVSRPRTRDWEFGGTEALGVRPRFEWDRRIDGVKVILLLWFFALTTAAGTLLPWASYRMRLRFSLRTLLLATPLVAVVLGLIDCALRQ